MYVPKRRHFFLQQHLNKKRVKYYVYNSCIHGYIFLNFKTLLFTLMFEVFSLEELPVFFA